MQVLKRDQTISIAVEVRPLDSEIVKALLLERNLGEVGLAEKRVNDDGNEEVEENLGHNDLEKDVKGHGEVLAATFRPV